MKNRWAFARNFFCSIASFVFFCMLSACASVPDDMVPEQSWPRLDPVPGTAAPAIAEPAIPPRAEASLGRKEAPAAAAAVSAIPEPSVPDLGPENTEDEKDAPVTELSDKIAALVEEKAVNEAPLPPAVSLTNPSHPNPAAANSGISQPSAGPRAAANGGELSTVSASKDKPADYFPPAERVATITTGPLRQMSGIVGTNFTVTLPGIGWIYLPDENAQGRIRYMGKVIERGDTVFAFAPFEKGDYNLRFQQQDLAANTLHYDDVNLTIASADEEPPAAGPSALTQPAAAPAASAPPGVPAASAAPAIPAQSASPAAPPAEQAQSASPAEGDKPAALDFPATPPPVVAAPPGDNAIPGESELARLQRLSKDGEASWLAELEKYIAAHEAEIPGLDELYFFLAQIYEKDTPARDMKKSLLYYEKVRDNFPLSPRWQASDLRSRYIRINYFDIR